MKMERRKFINILLGAGIMGWLGSIVHPLISFLIPPKIPEANVNSVKAGKVDDFEPNSGQIVKFGRKPVILIRMDNGDFRAFSATCTHLDCIVQYRDDTKRIWCACHNGIYDLKGKNVSGPPPRPLTEFTVNVVNNNVFVSKPKMMG